MHARHSAKTHENAPFHTHPQYGQVLLVCALGILSLSLYIFGPRIQKRISSYAPAVMDTRTPPATYLGEAEVVPPESLQPQVMVPALPADMPAVEEFPPQPVLPSSEDSLPPTVTITNPHEQDTVQPGMDVQIAITVFDNEGIEKMDFFVNNERVCSNEFGTYTCAWTVPSEMNATYQIHVLAYDLVGNVGEDTMLVVSR